MSILPSFGIVKLRILELDTWASEHSVFFFPSGFHRQ